jgi:hypothetical protein
MLPDTQEVTGYLQSIATNGKTIVAVGSNGLIFTCESDSVNIDKTSSSHFNQTHGKIKIDKKGKNRLEVRIPDSFGKKNVSFQIYSISGKRLRSIKGADGSVFHIPISGLSPGRYFLTVQWHGGKQTYPFIINH